MRQALASAWEQIRSGQRAAQATLETTAADLVLVCEWTSTALYGPDGAFMGMLSIVQDVTDRQQMQQQRGAGGDALPVRAEDPGVDRGVEAEIVCVDDEPDHAFSATVKTETPKGTLWKTQPSTSEPF